MVGACAHILRCRDSQIHYKYGFPGSYHPHAQPSSHQTGYPEPLYPEPASFSTHNIDLNIVGGNVPTPAGTNAELAAAAVSPYEAVVQVNGKSLIVPI